MAGDPRFWARTLRQYAGIGDSCPVDLDRLLSWGEIQFTEHPIQGFLGLHMCVNGQHGIMIKEGQSRGQRRFTIAHELGHFAIPHHADGTLRQCIEQDMAGIDVSRDIEREANEFAAELLMPRNLFLRDVASKLPSFAAVKKLAAPERYDVSVTACALRWVNLSNERNAIVCTEHGRIKWKWSSSNFRYALPPPGSPVLPETLTAAVLRGESVSDGVEAVPTWAWGDSRGLSGELLESTFTIPSLDQVLSLLVIVEEDREDGDDS